MSPDTISRRKPALAIWTFVAIVLTIAGVALIVVPILVGRYEANFRRIMHNSLSRQARGLAGFAERQLMEGRDKQLVLVDLQWIINSSQDEVGFSGVIDRDTLTVLCHPEAERVGNQLGGDGDHYMSTNVDGDRVPLMEVESWNDMVDTTGFGELVSADANDVIVMQLIAGTSWAVLTQSNIDGIAESLKVTRNLFYSMAGGLALLIALPTSLAARRVSRRYERTIEAREEKIRQERAKSEALLLNILPEKVADELKAGPGVIAEAHDNVAILFADLVGFTRLSGQIGPDRLVTVLNEIFSSFDDLADEIGVEKIKTIGDAYMACCGLPDPDAQAAVKIGRFAVAMLEMMGGINARHGLDLELRVGVHCGPVVAGVIGKRKFIYDIWGAAVNTASRMESSSLPGRVHVTSETRDQMGDAFHFESRGEVKLKGVGVVPSWFLTVSGDPAQS